MRTRWSSRPRRSSKSSRARRLSPKPPFLHPRARRESKKPRMNMRGFSFASRFSFCFTALFRGSSRSADERLLDPLENLVRRLALVDVIVERDSMCLATALVIDVGDPLPVPSLPVQGDDVIERYRRMAGNLQHVV